MNVSIFTKEGNVGRRFKNIMISNYSSNANYVAYPALCQTISSLVPCLEFTLNFYLDGCSLENIHDVMLQKEVK